MTPTPPTPSQRQKFLAALVAALTIVFASACREKPPADRVRVSGQVADVQVAARAARVDAAASADEIATAGGDLTLEIARAYWALVTAIEAARRYVVGDGDPRACDRAVEQAIGVSSMSPATS
jgi:hypothetical protein